METYCIKCRTIREIVSAENVTMKNGTPAVRGKCGTCGSGMYRIMKRST